MNDEDYVLTGVEKNSVIMESHGKVMEFRQ